ncbi:MAG: VOC family protein [Pseudomonadota bacterium]
MRRAPRLPGALLVLFGATAGAADGDAAKVTDEPWLEAVVSVTDLDRTARFFVDIGGYRERWRGAMSPGELSSFGLGGGARADVLLLGHAEHDSGLLRLVRFEDAGRQEPVRPGARSWDTGCYTSLMVRMKDIQTIYDEAIRLGWWTETPITYLEFGESKLNVVIFRGPDGVQVQGYERLSPPLPDAVGEFGRMTRPFNMMQMVRDRDAAYSFYTEVLGFDTFYKGKPYVAPEPQHSPLGIPIGLSTRVRYRAGIVYPEPGEFGRMEMIEIMDIDGRDHAARCEAPNLGVLAVRFPVDDAGAAQSLLRARDWPVARAAVDARIEPYGAVRLFSVKTPDGAIVSFVE